VTGSRAGHAAGILAVAIIGLLGAWFASGWRDVGARQREVRAAPVAAADRRGDQLADELRDHLATLAHREDDRPYFHYQNVFHDPRASTSWSVAPSPLANPPDDPLVLGYFQIDQRGRATTPTVNDEVPALTDPARRAIDVAFRDQAQHSLAAPVVASLVRASPPAAREVATRDAPQSQQQARVERYDSSTYAQNTASNAYYVSQQANAPAAPPPAPAAAPTVTIVVSALAWRTLPFAGSPAIVAVRQVDTPDGMFAQGFVVDRAAVARWVAAQGGDAVAEVRAGDGGRALVPGWQLAIAPSPHAVADAAEVADHIARDFLVTFTLAAVIAIVAAAFVVLVVVRAERLARERSQFAAAAAHELRTPLAGLQLYGDMLADGLGEPAKAGDYARRMSEEAARLGRVVSNVLGFSQLERGNLSVQPARDDLAAALRDIAERARPTLARAGAQLVVTAADPVTAVFDRDAVARIVGNLLDNAEKYARGAADRTIALAIEPGAREVTVVVTDHGPGIALPHALFRAFGRGGAVDAPAGLGLGLALSRSLARAMGGDLVHRATAGGGATFALIVPAGPAA
jgi:signal transduction histidine kinase